MWDNAIVTVKLLLNIMSLLFKLEPVKFKGLIIIICII